MNVHAGFVAQARKAPDAPAVITDAGVLSYAELARAVSWTMAGLRSQGIAPGDCVALWLPHQVQYLVASLALACLGAGQIPLQRGDSRHVLAELARRLPLAGSIAAADAPIASRRFDPPPAEIAELKALRAGPLQAVDDGALPYYCKRTSGTTSALMRITVFTHATGVPTDAAFPPQMASRPGCRLLNLGHMSFVNALNNVPRVLAGGGCLAIPGNLVTAVAAGEMLEFIARHQVNFMSGGPVHAEELLAEAKPGALLLPGVAVLRLSSTLVTEELRAAVMERLTPNLYITYSMNETGLLAAAGPAQLRRRPGTVGLPVPGVQVEVVDEAGKALPPGSRGLLRARTPWMAREYVGDPGETQRVFRDGWVQSGDLVELAADGELVHHGRGDDLMIFDGLNVMPAEIERVLLQHPAVAEACAFGVPSRKHGSIPAAAVVLKAKCDYAELERHCLAWLGARRPRAFLRRSQLPRNERGKLLRRALLDEYLAARRRGKPAP